MDELYNENSTNSPEKKNKKRLNNYNIIELEG